MTHINHGPRPWSSVALLVLTLICAPAGLSEAQELHPDETPTALASAMTHELSSIEKLSAQELSGRLNFESRKRAIWSIYIRLKTDTTAMQEGYDIYYLSRCAFTMSNIRFKLIRTHDASFDPLIKMIEAELLHIGTELSGEYIPDYTPATFSMMSVFAPEGSPEMAKLKVEINRNEILNTRNKRQRALHRFFNISQRLRILVNPATNPEQLSDRPPSPESTMRE